jgi:polyvinyl alcohol dehydrogenase (cytochrome)
MLAAWRGTVAALKLSFGKAGIRIAGTLLMLAGLTLIPAGSAASGAAAPTDWPAYLDGALHSSYNALDTAITPANARTLVKKWHFRGAAPTLPGQPGPALYSSPAVAGGAVFIGDNSGYFYKLNETTGAVLAKVFIGFQPKLTCAARGFIATATVAPDPVTGQDTVYVAAADGYLYALNASDLSLKWRSVIDIPSTTVSDFFDWSSPTVADGKIYVGSASHCDKPLTQGALVGFDQATGAEFARFFTVPNGFLGGGIWSSVAVDSAGNVYATTGSQPKNTTNRYDSVSIVKFDPMLNPLGVFTVPNSQLGGDGDFGGSPTIFGSDVGACDKNGIYYALNRATMTVDWETRIGAKSSSASPAQCSAAAIYDGKYLYMGGDPTTIGGVAFRGSVMRLDPATGAILWQTGLPNSVIGSPTMNGGGVIGVGTYDFTATPNAEYLIDSSTGKILKTLATGGTDFAQNVFANGDVFTANVGQGMVVFGLP